MKLEHVLPLTLALAGTAGAYAQKSPSICRPSIQAVDQVYRKTWGEPSKIEKKRENTPNILLITSDQHNFSCIGINDPKLKTPNLDRLARHGVVYDRAYTVNPVSTPTRCTIITGMYPSQHGAYALGTKMPENVPCIGDYLREIGYRSALIGKAHFQPLGGTADYPSMEAYPILQDLDFWRKFNGPFYGFDHVELCRNHTDEPHVGQHYMIWMIEKLKKNGLDSDLWKQWYRKPTGLMDQQHDTWNIPEEYHYDAWITERTEAMIDRFKKNDEPFFLWASFFDPHPVYIVPEPWASMYPPEEMDVPEFIPGDLDDMPEQYRLTQRNDIKGWNARWKEDGQNIHGLNYHAGKTREQKARDIATYFGMISMMDHYIGKILDKLEESGLLENTLIVFTTDHGHNLGHHNLIAKGAFAFESDNRIPFIVSYKGHFPENKRSSALVSLVDLAPTFLDIAGREIPMTMSGKVLTDLWAGKTDKVRDHVIVENHFSRTKFYQKSYIEERYKITWYMNSNEGELFDLEKDPDERTNLWDKPEYQKLKLEMLLKAHQADMAKENCWMPRVSGA